MNADHRDLVCGLQGADGKRAFVPTMMPSTALDGMAVLDPSGNRVGSVRHVLLDLCSGRTKGAVLTLGGLFPIGERYFPVPWDIVRFDCERRAFVTQAGPRLFRRAPSFERGGEPPWTEAFEKRLRRYYELED